MRPISIYIEGLNSFVEGQLIDFEAAGRDNIFCISGSTGSGKTTVLDAMLLSLYKKHSERGDLGDYVNLRCERAKIVFRFELEGDEYETTRIITRKSAKNSFVLRRAAESEPLAMGDDAHAFIQEKIGLSVSDFTHVVVLQQGAFSKFLKSTKAERMRLVSRLFNLERFDGLHSRFKEKRDDLEGKINSCDKALEGYEGVTAELIKGMESSLKDAVKELEGKKREAEAKRIEAEKIAIAFDEFTKQTRLRAETVALRQKEEECLLRLKKGEAMLAELTAEEQALITDEQQKDALMSARAEIKAALAQLDALQKKQAELGRKRKENDEKKQRCESVQKTLSELERQLFGIEGKIRIKQAENAVATLSATLKEGDACPVCGGTYHGKTHFSGADGGDAELEKLVEEGEVLRKKTEKTRAEALRLAGETESAEREITERGAEYEKERATLLKRAGEDGAGRLKEIESRLTAIADRRRSVDERKNRYNALLLQLRESHAEAKATLAAKQQLIKEVAPVSEIDYARIKAAAEAAVRAATEAEVQIGVLTERIEKAKADLNRKSELIKERAEHRKQQEKYAVLCSLFYRNAFSEFVAAEYIKDFTVAASEQLGRLTGGKYVLSYEEAADGDKSDFAVYDFLSGNEKRSVKTLSGGETFLASLSLAIAISKELSKSKSFNFFFIDEGFGTLSPDALDLVVAALETLSRDCLVGVITHRSELIERIPSVIEITPAGGETGSTVRLR